MDSPDRLRDVFLLVGWNLGTTIAGTRIARWLEDDDHRLQGKLTTTAEKDRIDSWIPFGDQFSSWLDVAFVVRNL